MRSIAKISPSIKLTARLSCNTNVRRYTSLVQVQQKTSCEQLLLGSDLAVKRFYGSRGSDITSKVCTKTDLYNINPQLLWSDRTTKRFYGTKESDLTSKGFTDIFKRNTAKSSSSILPIALIDLNPLSSNSSKVLLIPLNWHDADEHDMRTTITSIFSKPKNLQQIEAFSQALKDLPVYQKTKGSKASEKNAIEENKSPKDQLNLKDRPISENKQVIKNSFDVPTSDSLDHLEHLASAVERSLQQCCLHSMQMFVDDNLLGERIKGLKRFNAMNEVELVEPLGPTSIMKIDASKLNLKDISWNAFPENQISTLTNITFPISFSKKSYSTRTIDRPQQKALIEDRGPDSQMLITLRRKASSSSSVSSKCNPNYDFPYLSKLFGTKELLMSCDAYNKALIEAEKRRAALAECTAVSKQLNRNASSRPEVIKIKGCTKPKLEVQQNLQTSLKPARPACPPPVKKKKQASDGCKKDDPCKPPECPNPCKDEMEKLERLKNEEMRKKRNQSPTGCESPKCKKEDGCTKFRKSPCKKVSSNQTKDVEIKCSLKSPDKATPQMADSCKKDDPCKPPQCPNPCKDEMEKLQHLKEEEARKNKNKIPTGCISPKCKKEDTCTKRKENPCKKASASSVIQGSLWCNKKGCGKSKDKKQKNPCLDDHAEYKPKCNIDPCKQGGSPCGGGAKPAGPPTKKKADPCGGEMKKKEDPCEKFQTKKDPCKMKDICGGNKQKEDPCKKKESSPCGSKKEDPCKNRKSSPCGSRKEDPCKQQKEDPCKKKRDSSKSPCGSKKEDPCKKKRDSSKSPCGSKKEDPCKKQTDDPCKKKKDPCGGKKEDPCKKSKDDPCKKKKDSGKSPCGSKKEDPCKKSKDDPCKKKKDSGKSPCGSKKEDPCKKSKDDPCKKKKSSSPCASDTKKEDPCKKKPTSPCKPKKDSKSKCQKSSGSKKKVCGGKQRKETKPKCGQNKKSFSTSAAEGTTNYSCSSLIKRTFTNFTAMPSIRNKNWFNRHFSTRNYSSKGRDGSKKSADDLGRASQCKSVETKVPPKRKPAFNPHPKDGLRKCYPTYDMDCQQFCKDARKTDCRKYAFLKDTDNNKRNGKK